MKIFMVVLLVQCSTVAAVNKLSCKEQEHLKKTEMQLLKDKMDNDRFADVEAIVTRLYVLAEERSEIKAKCKTNKRGVF